MWREGLGCYKILTEDKKGYRNHPAVKEFEKDIESLWFRLHLVREEMLKRGYHPKPLPSISNAILFGVDDGNEICICGRIRGSETPWQTLEEQVEIIKNKNCNCNI